MRIDETRHDDAVAIVVRRNPPAEALRQQRHAGPAPQDRAVIADDHGALALMADIMVRLAEAQRLAPDDARHGATRSSMRKRKMRQTCVQGHGEFVFLVNCSRAR